MKEPSKILDKQAADIAVDATMTNLSLKIRIECRLMKYILTLQNQISVYLHLWEVVAEDVLHEV